MTNNKITLANKAIQESNVLGILNEYSPKVVSTIFVGLDTEDSDIDIVCSYHDQDVFSELFSSAFSKLRSYSLRLENDYILGQFCYGNFIFEVYASAIPVKEQNAYRHYKVMQRLVDAGGVKFKQHIKHLKQQGLKTEPAICQALGILGEPYRAILEIENWTDQKLEEVLRSFNQCSN